MEDNAVLPLNQWTHIAGTYDGSELKLFRDGVLAANKFVGQVFGENEQPLMIGAQSNGPNNNYRGDIDEVLIYQSALTDQEILEIYQNGFALRKKDLSLIHI